MPCQQRLGIVESRILVGEGTGNRVELVADGSARIMDLMNSTFAVLFFLPKQRNG